MKKIAIINQRYGLEVNGGSELYARILAERLNPFYAVEVLTTCALEYTTWENYYPEGVCKINGVNVRRFKVDRPRDARRFNEVNTRILTTERGNQKTEQEWVDEQGPYCPALIDYIRENEAGYDVFIFVTYLYYLTVRGIELVRDKAILVPTAHDEPFIYFNIYKNIFTCPKAFLFLTDEEKSLIHGIFHNQSILSDVAGSGIDVPLDASPEAFKSKYGINDYFVYVGRIDEGKACDKMFEYFIKYKQRNKNEYKLVLMGKAVMPVPKRPDIISLGFVSEEDKYNGIAGAKLLILPSFYESLSISVLESMAVGVPVVVNGKCAVLKGHCVKSNAGLYYRDYFEFEGCVNYMLAHDGVYAVMQTNARQYVEQNYRWDVIINKLRNMVERAGGSIYS